MSKKNNLNKRQAKFLAVLFDEANGDLHKAKKMAGYSSSTRTAHVVRHLQNEIVEATKKYLAAQGPKAAVAMTSVLDDPTQMGTKDKLAAAKDILDRGGVKPAEHVEITAHNPMFILPPKDKSKE